MQEVMRKRTTLAMAACAAVVAFGLGAGSCALVGGRYEIHSGARGDWMKIDTWTGRTWLRSGGAAWQEMRIPADEDEPEQ